MLRIATFMIGLLLTTGAVAAAAPPTPRIGLGSGLGCGAQCIKKALVTPTMTGGSLEVKTDTAARIKIWVSDQAPGSIDGKPWVPFPDDYLETWNYYFSHRSASTASPPARSTTSSSRRRTTRVARPTGWGLSRRSPHPRFRRPSSTSSDRRCG